MDSKKGRQQWTVTDRGGRFQFANVRGGYYKLIVRPFLNTQAQLAEQMITIAATTPLQVEIRLKPVPKNPGPMIAPYGAPAARRRIV